MIYLICKPIYVYKVHSCSLRSKTRIPNICHIAGILQLLAPWILTKPCKEIGLFFVCLFVFSLNEEREARRMKQIALDHTGKERDWDLALCFLIRTTQLVSTDTKFSEKSWNLTYEMICKIGTSTSHIRAKPETGNVFLPSGCFPHSTRVRARSLRTWP